MSNWRVSFMIRAPRGDRVIHSRLPCWRCLHRVFAAAVRIGGVDTDSGTRAGHPQIARSTSDQLVPPQENEREQHQQKGDDPQLKLGDL